MVRTVPGPPGRVDASSSPAVPPAAVSRGSFLRRHRLVPYALLLPSAVVIGGLVLWPAVQIGIYSFQDYGLQQVTGAAATQWVGAANYSAILSDPEFWLSLRISLLFAAVVVPLTLVTGTLVGLLLHRLGRRMATFVSGAALLAWATPAVSAGVIFVWLADPDGGIVDWTLSKLPHWLGGGAHWAGFSWTNAALPAYTLTTVLVVWTSFPFIAISVLAGLRTIPAELHDSARVDGAGGWRIFWRVTYPLLRPIFQVLFLLSVIWDFACSRRCSSSSGNSASATNTTWASTSTPPRSSCRRPTAWPRRWPSSSRSSCSSSRSATSGHRSKKGRSIDDPRAAFGTTVGGAAPPVLDPADAAGRAQPARAARRADHPVPDLLDGVHGVQAGHRVVFADPAPAPGASDAGQLPRGDRRQRDRPAVLELPEEQPVRDARRGPRVILYRAARGRRGGQVQVPAPHHLPGHAAGRADAAAAGAGDRAVHRLPVMEPAGQPGRADPGLHRVRAAGHDLDAAELRGGGAARDGGGRGDRRRRAGAGVLADPAAAGGAGAGRDQRVRVRLRLQRVRLRADVPRHRHGEVHAAHLRPVLLRKERRRLGGDHGRLHAVHDPGHGLLPARPAPARGGPGGRGGEGVSGGADPGLLRLADAILIPPFPGLGAPDWVLRALERGLGGAALRGASMGGASMGGASMGGAVAGDPVIAIDEEGGDVTRVSFSSGCPYPG